MSAEQNQRNETQSTGAVPTNAQSKSGPDLTQEFLSEHNGSKVIDYNQDAPQYNAHRACPHVAEHARVIIEACERSAGSVGNAKLGLLCCGTGRYDRLILEEVHRLSGQFPKEVCAVDGSSGMLTQARQELLQAGIQVKAKISDVVEDGIPLEPSDMDCITCFHAIQHWTPEHDLSFREVRNVFEGVRKSLRRGGSFVLVFGTNQQTHDSSWYIGIQSEEDRMRDPGHSFASTFPPLEVTLDRLKDAGFATDHNIRVETLRGLYVNPDTYLGDPELFLKPEVQAASSFFRYMHERGTYEQWEATFKQMIADGSFEEHRKHSEENRLQGVGLATQIVVEKQ